MKKKFEYFQVLKDPEKLVASKVTWAYDLNFSVSGIFQGLHYPNTQTFYYEG